MSEQMEQVGETEAAPTEVPTEPAQESPLQPEPAPVAPPAVVAKQPCGGCKHSKAVHIPVEVDGKSVEQCTWVEEDGQSCRCDKYTKPRVSADVGMVPIAKWNCPGCEADEGSLDPRLIQSVARAQVLEVQCGRCGTYYELSRSLIVQMNQGPNRHAKRAAVAQKRVTP